MQQLEVNLNKVGALGSFLGVLRVIFGCLECHVAGTGGVLASRGRLDGAKGVPMKVPFWAVSALSGAEMGPKGAILEIKWQVNGSQNRSKTHPKINAKIKLI